MKKKQMVKIVMYFSHLRAEFLGAKLRVGSLNVKPESQAAEGKEFRVSMRANPAKTFENKVFSIYSYRLMCIHGYILKKIYFNF